MSLTPRAAIRRNAFAHSIRGAVSISERRARRAPDTATLISYLCYGRAAWLAAPVLLTTALADLSPTLELGILGGLAAAYVYLAGLIRRHPVGGTLAAASLESVVSMFVVASVIQGSAALTQMIGLLWLPVFWSAHQGALRWVSRFDARR